MAKKLLCVIALMITLVCVLASCGHKHEFGEWETAQEATCSNAGSRKRYCNCGEIQTEALLKKDHKIEEGMCSDCKEIFDPYKALIRIIKTEGEKSESSNDYSFPKNEYIGNGAKTFINYDADSDKLSVISASESILFSMDINPSESKQIVDMIVQISSKTYYSTGYIYNNTFDMESSTVHGFSTNAPDYLFSNMNNLATVNTKIALDNLSNIIKIAHESLTLKTIGFEKFSN